MQQGDFEKLYETMEDQPVNIRFLDPPLHEFVPTEEADIELLAKNTGKTVEEVTAACERDHFLSADEAKDFGLIDKIIYSKK